MGYSLSIQLDLSNVIESAFRSQESAAVPPVRSVRQIAKGETIYQYGDRAAATYHLRSGRIKLTRHTADGKVITFRTVTPGELFGETDIYLDTHQCEASAEVDSSVIVYPNSQILSWVSEDASLARAFLQQGHLLLLMLKKRLTLLMIQSVRERTLEYFRERTADLSCDCRTVALNKPLKAVAEELDISPEAFYRTLARLEADGLIRRDRRQITLL
ncbi:MAG: Crp/Fnr family transcriptional regulator [Elainellaceae cyanobacterium]